MALAEEKAYYRWCSTRECHSRLQNKLIGADFCGYWVITAKEENKIVWMCHSEMVFFAFPFFRALDESFWEKIL